MSRRIQDSLRRLRAGEVHRLTLGASGDLRALVLFPNSYQVGMTNLGLHALLEQVSAGGARVDRAFLPDGRLVAEHRRTGTPILGLESGLPLRSFDLILCSVSFEPDYVGLVQMLQLSKLPPLARDRGPGDPLIVGGGMAPTLNPEPLSRFCDLIGIGEAEVLVPPLMDLMRARLPREALLEEIQKSAGWYMPGAARPVERQAAEPLDPCYPVIVSPQTAFKSHVDLEISRGCRWRCRFCAAGHVVTPYREHDAAALRPAIAWALKQRQRVGLVGTDVSDHGDLEAIAEEVWRQGGEVALPSLRVESLARRTGATASLIRRRPPRSLTMAVESATEQLRCGLGKRLTDARVLEAARQAAAAGVRQLRVYLLVSVPGEEQGDLDRIIDLSRDLLEVGPGKLTLSVNGLVPKAGTPLQWGAAPDRGYLKQTRTFLRRSLPLGRLELSFESPDWTRWQAYLSLADHSASRHILRAADNGWREALSRAAAEEPLLRGEDRWPDAPLPWRHVISGFPETVLRQERTRCLNREYIPPARIK